MTVACNVFTRTQEKGSVVDACCTRGKKEKKENIRRTETGNSSQDFKGLQFDDWSLCVSVLEFILLIDHLHNCLGQRRGIRWRSVSHLHMNRTQNSPKRRQEKQLSARRKHWNHMQVWPTVTGCPVSNPGNSCANGLLHKLTTVVYHQPFFRADTGWSLMPGWSCA